MVVQRLMQAYLAWIARAILVPLLRIISADDALGLCGCCGCGQPMVQWAVRAPTWPRDRYETYCSDCHEPMRLPAGDLVLKLGEVPLTAPNISVDGWIAMHGADEWSVVPPEPRRG